MANGRQRNKIQATRLTSTDEIDGARALLHRVYHEEQHWAPPHGNPSGQRIKCLSSGHRGFVDRYDHTCTWIGLICDRQVVGCVRLIERSENQSCLELENYFILPASFVGTAGELVEVNRLALAQEHRRGPGALMIVNEVLNTAHRTGKSLIAAVTSTSASCATRYAGMEDTGLRFAYHPDDPEEVSVHMLLNDGIRIGNQLHVIQGKIAELSTSSL